MGDPCTDSTDCASLTCRGNGGGRVTATCQHCSQGFDCPSDHCNTDTGTCESCVPNCGINTTCNYDRDCASGYCDLDMETCQPSSSPTPTPTPACAPHCAIGANCTSDEDCDSGYCQPDMNTCQNPEICDNSLDDDHNNLIDCLDNTVCDCTETVSVTVTYPGEDGNPKPVVGATINFTYTADNVTNQTITLTTDDAGQAETDLNGLWEGNGIVYTKIYFEDADFKLMNSAGTDYYRSDVSFAAVNENDLQRDIPLGGNDRTVARIWDRLHEVYDFYTTGLGTNVDYQMPEEIYLMTPGVGGRHSIDWTDNHDYGITFGDIVFGRGFGAKESPQNQEWHEFNHHAMAAIYGGWWDTHAIKNHLGWGNPFSDDSYVEAFAEFMSMVETAHYASEYPRLAAVPSVYYYAGTAANLEKNYKVNNSRYEELAIASILWDLYDPPSNSQIDKDHIQIEWDVLWQVLSGQHEYSDGRVGYIHSTRDLYEAVWALNMSQFNMMYNDTYEPNNDSWMDKANALDKIFIAHGAFYDKNGNGIWDGPEEMVGYTSKQGNPGMIRSDLEPPPGSYVHANVNNGQVQNGTVKVKVTHPGPYSYLDYEYEGDFQDGLIAIDPPFDVPTTWEMNITSKGYSESAPVTVTSEDYNSKYNETNGYFDSVAVSIRPIATPTPAATRTPAPHSTPCSPYCGTGKSCTSNYDCASDYCDPATGTCQPATTPSSSTSSCCTSSFILAALGGLVYISKKSGLKSAE